MGHIARRRWIGLPRSTCSPSPRETEVSELIRTTTHHLYQELIDVEASVVICAGLDAQVAAFRDRSVREAGFP